MPSRTHALALVIVVLAAGAVAGAEPPNPEKSEKPENPEKLDQLAERLATDASFKVRLQAAILLGRSKDSRALQPLLAALRDDHYTVRGAASLSLGNLALPTAVGPLLHLAATDDVAYVRGEAKSALRRFAHRTALPFVISASSSSDLEIRREAIELLAGWTEDEARFRLVEALGDVEPIRGVARDSLAAMGQDAMTELLRLGLDSGRSSVRLSAVTLLGELGTQKAVSVLMDAYEQEVDSDELRRHLRGTLRSLRRLMPASELERDATESSDRFVVARALKFLGVLGGDRALEILVAALERPDVYLRGIAALSLADAGDPRAIAPLAKLIENQENARIVQIVRNSIQILQRKTAPLRD